MDRVGRGWHGLWMHRWGEGEGDATRAGALGAWPSGRQGNVLLPTAPVPPAPRASGRRYDPVEARTVMGVLYAVGTAIALAMLVLPPWPGSDRGVLAALTCAALTVAVVVPRLRSLPLPAAVALTSCGNLLVASAQWAAGGGTGAVGALYALSLTVSFLFYPAPALVGQIVLAAVAEGTVLAILGAGRSLVLTVVVTVGSACGAGIVVRKLADLRARAEEELAWRAAHDGLTGLANRVALTRAWAALPSAEGTPVSVLVLDLRGFKKVNDVLGHHYGDALLVQVAERLRRLPPPALPCRLGGDEFAVLLPGAGRAEAVEHAAAVRDALHQRYEVGGVEVPLGATIGTATRVWPASPVQAAEQAVDGDDAGLRALSALLAEADAAMYYARGADRSVATADDARASLRRAARRTPSRG